MSGSITRSKVLLASAILAAAAAPGFSNDTNAPVAPVDNRPHVSVNCPGISSVPMTADAEQALPMQLTATLACNEAVVILADNEGYTARIRTAQGKEGYVARMYLNFNGSGANLADDAQLPSATPVNNIVRWQNNAPGCEQFSTKGHVVESASANGVTVQVSIQDTGWKLRATIAISYTGGDSLEVLPTLITLDELQPNLRTLQAQDPAKLSHVANHQVLYTEATAQPSRSAQFFGAKLSTASYLASTPNYFDSVPATARDHGSSDASSDELKSFALKQVKLQSGQKTAGVIWFQRDVSARELSLRVPVGDLVFDFPFSFNDKK